MVLIGGKLLKHFYSMVGLRNHSIYFSLILISIHNALNENKFEASRCFSLISEWLRNSYIHSQI